jgi:hypothetical protein
LLGASKATANAAIIAAGFTVGTVSIANTDNPALVDTLVTPLSSNGVDIVNGPINYTIYSPFFPPFFPPSFCSCGTCTWGGSYSCEGTLSYEYYTCGCAGCPGEGGYNPAYRDGICGYTAPPDPCAGYVCTSYADCAKYAFTDVSVNSADCPASTACYMAYGDCNCGCPATTANRLFCGACP